jgi:hypothetical protein
MTRGGEKFFFCSYHFLVTPGRKLYIAGRFFIFVKKTHGPVLARHQGKNSNFANKVSKFVPMI